MFGSVLKIILIFAFSVLFSQAQDILVCNSNYALLSPYCYGYYTLPQANYDEALEVCRNDGGDLVSIHNEDENGFVGAMNNTEGVLIGLRYDKGSHTYRWSDGSMVNYTQYADLFSVQMHYFGECVQIIKDKWSSVHCEKQKLPFVCKMKASTYEVSSKLVCPDPDILYYAPATIVSPGYPLEYALTQQESSAGCEYKILSPNNYLLKFHFTDVAMANNTGEINVYSWWTEDSASLTARVDNRLMGGRTMVNANLAMLTFSGSQQGRWRITVEPVKDQGEGNNCFDREIVYTESSVILSPGFPNYYSLPTRAVQSGCIYKIAAKKDASIWLRFDDLVFDADSGFIEVFKQWDVTNSTNHVFRASSRNLGQRLLIDSAQALLRVWNSPRGKYKISWWSMKTELCPDGWRYFNGSCYYFDNTEKIYADSEAFCKAKGGHIVTVSTADENSFISSLNSSKLWIGLGKSVGGWSWTDRKQFEYSHWYPGRVADCASTGSDCAVMNNNGVGYWTEWNCKDTAETVCEYEVKRVRENA